MNIFGYKIVQSLVYNALIAEVNTLVEELIKLMLKQRTSNKTIDELLAKEAAKDKASRDLLDTTIKMQVVIDNQEKRIDELVAQSNRLYEEKLAIAEELTKYIRTNGELAAHLSELYTAFDELASEYQYLATTMPTLRSRPTKDVTNSTRQKYEVFKAKYPRILDKSSSIQRVVEQSVDDRPVDG